MKYLVFLFSFVLFCSVYSQPPQLFEGIEVPKTEGEVYSDSVVFKNDTSTFIYVGKELVYVEHFITNGYNLLTAKVSELAKRENYRISSVVGNSFFINEASLPPTEINRFTKLDAYWASTHQELDTGDYYCTTQSGKILVRKQTPLGFLKITGVAFISGAYYKFNFTVREKEYPGGEIFQTIRFTKALSSVPTD